MSKGKAKEAPVKAAKGQKAKKYPFKVRSADKTMKMLSKVDMKQVKATEKGLTTLFMIVQDKKGNRAFVDTTKKGKK